MCISTNDGYLLIGYLPDLNMSFAMATNVGEEPMGMNMSMGRMENMRMTSVVPCPVLQAIIQIDQPGFPDFICP